MKKKWKIILSITVVLIAIRIVLPYVLLYFANKELATLKGYYGHVEDIDISLYRGAYQIEHIYLRKIAEKDTVDFINIKLVDLAIEWKPILNGEIVGKVWLDSGTIQITKEINDVSDFVKDTAHFRNVFKSLMPIDLNRLEIKNSSIRYKDLFSSPPLDMKLTDLNIVALNLSNGYDSSNVLPASFIATANVYEGKLNMKTKFDPFAADPKFDLDARLEKTNLVLINDFMREYVNVDVNKGFFGIYTEAAAKNGKIDGYIKPLITDLDIVEFKKEEGSLLQIAYESLIGTAAWMFKNQRMDQQATKIYVSGDLKTPKFGIVGAIIEFLRNAFISALKPRIDREITLNSLNDLEKNKNVFEKIFKSKAERKTAKARRKKEKK